VHSVTIAARPLRAVWIGGSSGPGR
jgi:hypothetical protein